MSGSQEKKASRIRRITLPAPSRNMCLYCYTVHEAGTPHDFTSAVFKRKFRDAHGREAVEEDAARWAVGLPDRPKGKGGEQHGGR